MRLLYCLALVSFAVAGCRKTEDIGNSFQPAISNARAFQCIAAHTFVPVAEVLRDWGNSRASVPALQLTDSGIWFDYKKGIVCTDGLTRKGKCFVKNGFSMNAFEDTCWFSASPEDSFAVMSSIGAVYFTGKLKLVNFSAYEILINGTVDISTPDKQHSIRIDGLIELNSDGQSSRSALLSENWHADVIIAGEELYHYKVSRESGCFPCFSRGNGHNPSYSVTADFNPFGNAACDPVVKLTSGREEWLVDLW